MMEWQPIETAPKDGTDILGRAGDDCTTVYWCDAGKYWQLCVTGAYAEDGEWWPELWMPLPDAPKEDKND